MQVPIGIDLGTTFSVVAQAREDGSVVALPNDSGSLLTPSVVYFEGSGKVTVGEDAKAIGHVSPDRVVSAIKRQMGTDASLRFDGEDFTPEAISAIILRALAGAAGRGLSVPVNDLISVVTVPAYFGVSEREATAAAAAIAGLECLDLIAEPVAAALAYGVEAGRPETSLVFDLGGGTFDVTVVEFGTNVPRVVAVDGSNELGGLNFDERLSELILQRFARQTGDSRAAEDEGLILRVALQAETVKKNLSRTTEAVALVEAIGRRERVTVSRTDFENATTDLVAETVNVSERVIASGIALGAGRPTQIVLVGGSSRMPMIRAALEHRLRMPSRLSDPDLVVAKGAAIHSRNLLCPSRPLLNSGRRLAAARDHMVGSDPVRSVVPRAIGIKLNDSTDRDGQRVFVEHLVMANAPLPVLDATATFATILDGQQRVRVELMEQAGAISSPDCSDNRRVLDGELSGLPPNLPAGSPIDLHLAIGTDGRISCTARERSSGIELEMESYMEGVSDTAQTESQRRVVSGLQIKE